MSLIFDALKRVERERRLKAPDLGSIYSDGELSRPRRTWPKILLVGALLLNAIALAVFFRPASMPAVEKSLFPPKTINKVQDKIAADSQGIWSGGDSLPSEASSVQRALGLVDEAVDANSTRLGGGVSGSVADGDSRASEISGEKLPRSANGNGDRAPSALSDSKMSRAKRNSSTYSVVDEDNEDLSVVETNSESISGFPILGEKVAAVNHLSIHNDDEAELKEFDSVPSDEMEALQYNSKEVDKIFEELEASLIQEPELPSPANERPPMDSMLRSDVKPQPVNMGNLPSVDKIYLLNELSESVRRSLPDLQMNAHFYSDDPSRRFIFIGSSSYGEGDSIGVNGPIVEEIVPDGAVMNRNGVRFKAPMRL